MRIGRFYSCKNGGRDSKSFCGLIRTNSLAILVFIGCQFISVPYGLAVEAQQDPATRYHNALMQIQNSGVLTKLEVPPDFFAQLDWVGKTALMNLVCHSANSNESLCQSVVNQGLTDEALVIRDHALRTVLADKSLSGTVKETVAQKIVDDDRNYRKGKAFWIVQNAQSYLTLTKKREPSE